MPSQLESSPPLAPLSPPIVSLDDSLNMEDVETDHNGNMDLSITSNNTLTNETPKTVIKRPRNKDFSKFNRSNRKSKNCAIFYYKHVDTDTEQTNRKLAENGDEAFVSSEPTSDEEQWDYSSAKIDEDQNEDELNGNLLLDEDLQLSRRLSFGDNLDFVNYEEDELMDIVKVAPPTHAPKVIIFMSSHFIGTV